MSGKRLSGIYLIAILFVMVSGLFSGCSTKLSESQVEYANPIIDNILDGIREKDYDTFSKDFGSTMKNTIKKEDFDAFAANMDSQYGDYSGRSFTGATKDNAGNIVVTFDAQYSKASHLPITLYINDSNGYKSVVGLLFETQDSNR